MPLKVHYDREADIVTIRTGRTPSAGSSLEDTMHVVVETGCEGDHDAVGIIVIGASSYLAPHFMPYQRKHPLSHYDKETDTLTLGTATTDPAMISQAGEYLTAYWKRDELDENDLNIIGVALRNAAKHLTPFFKPRDHYARRNG